MAGLDGAGRGARGAAVWRLGIQARARHFITTLQIVHGTTLQFYINTFYIHQICREGNYPFMF